MRFVEIELTGDRGKRRVNPDQVAWLVANQDDTSTTLVFTGFAGGLLELQAKGSEAEVAALLETVCRAGWWGLDLGVEPSTGAVRTTFADGQVKVTALSAEDLYGGSPIKPAPFSLSPELVERFRKGPTVSRAPGAINLAELIDIPSSNRAKRRAAAKAAQTLKGKS